MTDDKSLREQLEEAYTEHSAPVDPADVVTEPVAEPTVDRARDEQGKFTVKETIAEPVADIVAEPPAALPAPQSWTGPMKEKWHTLPPDVQAEINRRENDVHKLATSHDGELRLGREMKDVITPYMPIIQAEGGTPATAVQSLLNTAYQLRTGTPERKAQLIQEIARTYGVDMGAMQGQTPTQEANYIQQLQMEIQNLKQTLNPQAIMAQLQEHQEHGRLVSDIQAFAANPANKHFETVKAAMAPLLSSGQAKDLQEAYDMACWANPSIRSTLLESQKTDEAAKRKAEIEAKKSAAVSIKGSPSAASGNTKPPERSLRDELAANMASALGSKI